ncbi:MAG TPA: ArsR family transcriptional regulator [bacterium]
MVNHLDLDPALTRDPAVLDLLGDPARRRLIVLLAERPRHPTELARALRVSRPAISRHLRLLRARGLLDETRGADDGRARLCRLRGAPLGDAADWLQAVRQFWSIQLTAFSRYVADQAQTPRRRPSHTRPRRRKR